jgi:hypothetical protein
MPLLRATQYLASVFLFLFLSSASSDVPEDQAAEVEHLINYLADSDNCRMIRNGKSYSAEDGAKHVRRKYNYFRDEISSTEEFIEYAGTKSTKSGRLYEVLCIGQEPEFSRDWLLEELSAYRSMQ